MAKNNNKTAKKEVKSAEKKEIKLGKFDVLIQGIKFTVGELKIVQLKAVRDVFNKIKDDIDPEMSPLDIAVVLVETGHFAEFVDQIILGQPGADKINYKEFTLNDAAEVTEKFFLQNERTINALTRLFGNLASKFLTSDQK